MKYEALQTKVSTVEFSFRDLEKDKPKMERELMDLQAHVIQRLNKLKSRERSLELIISGIPPVLNENIMDRVRSVLSSIGANQEIYLVTDAKTRSQPAIIKIKNSKSGSKIISCIIKNKKYLTAKKVNEYGCCSHQH